MNTMSIYVLRMTFAIVLIAVVSGCASVNRVGSKAWLRHEIQELDRARATGEITVGEYWEQRHEAEAVRMERKQELRAAQIRHLEFRDYIFGRRRFPSGAYPVLPLPE